MMTLVLTACIALFADGENRQAISDELAAQRQITAMKHAEADQLALKATPRREVRYRQSGGFYDNADVVDAAPANDTGGVGQSVIGDNGISRGANRSDLGVLGLPGLTDLRSGKPSKLRNKALRPGAESPGPTAAQRKSFQDAAQLPE